jgi:glycosyltransferase involved in cell wall biosynthesis
MNVSILLPNLNNRPYLEQRMESIRAQTWGEWELIVMDGCSQDGAWEFFQACAAGDSRIKLYQSKERGIYNNFNKCIRLARGEYVYFATSDDTMSPDALEKMATALEKNPECDIAHCKLKIIDEKGGVSEEKSWDDFFIVKYFGNLIDRMHIRRAPHDGILHFCGITVYTSLTQLLIRRRLFDRIGLFLADFGPIADFEWEMRATLLAHTVHVPEYLATWRLHRDQATSAHTIHRAKAEGKFLKMAGHALRVAKRLEPEMVKRFNMKELKYLLLKEKLFHEAHLNRGSLEKCISCLKWLLLHPSLTGEFYKTGKNQNRFLSQESFLDYIKEIIGKYGLADHLVVKGVKQGV